MVYVYFLWLLGDEKPTEDSMILPKPEQGDQEQKKNDFDKKISDTTMQKEITMRNQQELFLSLNKKYGSKDLIPENVVQKNNAEEVDKKDQGSTMSESDQKSVIFPFLNKPKTYHK